MTLRVPKPTPRTAGYEPAKGFPDPREQIIPASTSTHLANPNGGLVCGRPAPTNAAQYSADSPTCPQCADYLSKTRAHTDRIHGSQGIYAQRAAAAASAEDSPGETE